MDTAQPCLNEEWTPNGELKRKRESLDTQETVVSSIFDTQETASSIFDTQETVLSSVFDTSPDRPPSPLSEVPDDLSECSLALKNTIRVSKSGITRWKSPPPTKIVKFNVSRKLLELAIAPRCRLAASRPAVSPLWDYPALYELSKKLAPPTEKLEPAGVPEVWADGRVELCETLHYFRSWQAGGYMTAGFAKGFMFDKSAHSRDYIDSTVVISRAGGGLVRDKETRAHVMRGDQNEDSKVGSLRNSMKYFNPVVIIAGSENPNIRSKPPHMYCVMDYFKPTHIWSEKSNGKKLLRYRFEKLNVKKPSWWAPRGELKEPVPLGSLPPPPTKDCPLCGKESQQVYLQGWVCLQPNCNAFWRLEDGNEPVEDDLIYDPRFLKQATAWPNDGHDYPLAPDAVELSSQSMVGEDRAVASWLGMVCPVCGRCNSRFSWIGWECGNSACNFKKYPPITVIPATTLRDPFNPLTTEYALSRDTHLPLVTLSVSFSHNYRINRYTIPGIDGFVVHLVANKSVIEEPGGPNDMFEELQQKDIGLRRRPMDNAQMKGGSYTRHFAVNYGMPYKFIAATASSPFDNAARAITATRSRLNWASRFMLQDKHHDFNEVLALGYFEQQKINYHDDGEHGLGPTIATLSLGAPGTMRIRMKAKHHHGVSAAGIYDKAPPLPGCASYAARLAAAAELSTLETGSKALQARLRALPTELGLSAKGHAKDAITMALGHGDVVIMHGAGIQKYYEHSVDHAGKLRFALTCRYIEPGSLREGDRPAYEVRPDEGWYDGAALRGE
ncbi:hypothetical protein EJ04DRAFT_88042 [Polyplosphaeria fusca]|uniref:Alpha-ketoglutarate-dependent dioxygenase AlkB-like domain-containing protein n=1 Tax=Polyplosphaeria fusca TaxID=682080 RepID=A0A9P4UY23_9PLEO|nr:hypothetical protein EJ04DRAFT_88042 [Polyplosphaeria fusca]